MKTSAILVGCLLGSTFGQQRVARYDGLTFTPGFTTPLAGPNASYDTPFIYKGLNYTNWYQGTSGTNGTANGVIPASKPNVIGSPQYRADQQDAQNYPLKKIAVTASHRSFDLLSFQYACQGLTTSAATGCDLAVIGTYANGSQVPATSFVYFVSQRAASGMFLAVLPPAFRDLKEVVLGVGNGEYGTGPTVQVLDDVTYVLHG